MTSGIRCMKVISKMLKITAIIVTTCCGKTMGWSNGELSRKDKKSFTGKY